MVHIFGRKTVYIQARTVYSQDLFKWKNHAGENHDFFEIKQNDPILENMLLSYW